MPKIEHYTKEELLKKCKEVTETPGFNRMGCSESWYDPFFTMKETFSEGELGAMTEQELNNLYKLACNITSALY